MRKSVITILPGLALVLALIPLPEPARAQEAGLSGVWMLNQDESEDARVKFQEAMASGTRGGGRGGGRGARGAGGPDRGQMQETMQMVMQAAMLLTITQDDSTVTILGSKGSEIVVYPDGREIEVPIEDVGTVETKARWKGDKLQIERKFEAGLKITATYELKSDGKQMHVQTKFEGGPMPSTVNVRRVYDARAEDG